MTISDLSILVLVFAVAYFVTSIFARRTPDLTSKIHMLKKVLGLIVVVLAVIYFYQRFTG